MLDSLMAVWCVVYWPSPKHGLADDPDDSAAKAQIQDKRGTRAGKRPREQVARPVYLTVFKPEHLHRFSRFRRFPYSIRQEDTT